MTHPDMTTRIARFAKLRPLPIQADPSVPQDALDLIYSRKLLPVVGLENGAETAVSVAAPIQGAAGITITLAFCPPGQGPELHAHKATFETFTVLQGQFEFRWGDEAAHSVSLDRFDALSVPPLVYRAFRNVGTTDGILQVVISGGRHDATDIDMPPAVMDRLKAKSVSLFKTITAAGVTSGAVTRLVAVHDRD